MPQPTFDPDRFRKGFLLILTAAISILFFKMIKDFLIAVLLAAILSGLFYPLYRKLETAFRGHRAIASATTVIIALFVIVIPLTAFLGVVTAQGVQLSRAVEPWIDRQVALGAEFEQVLARLPFVGDLLDRLAPYRDQIVTKLGELVGNVGALVVRLLASAARGTAVFFLMLFIMLYAMFFFLMDGRQALNLLLYYMPLASDQEERMVGRFMSVARATIKGTFIIGIVQGGLAGAAFFIAGIGGSAFWTAVMIVLSIIPGLGTALVWVPAVIYLYAVGDALAATLLLIWCATVVGTVDNLMRPWLVGRDTKMPDLLILLTTLGGLVLFGATGFIIGPIVGALFVTVWAIYGETFKDVLPPVTPLRSAPQPEGEGA